MKFLLLIFIFISCANRSKPTICEYLKLDNCNNSKRNLGRTAGTSAPTVNAAAFSNPAAIALSRGLGIESIHFDGKAQLGLVTGTGRVGAAISNFPSDGTFFGNPAIESKNQYRERQVNHSRLEEEKLVLASAVNLFGAKSKKGLQVDVGLMYRRHKTLEKDFYGGGITLTYNKIISLGVAGYQDVYFSDLRGISVSSYDQNGNESTTVLSDNNINLHEVPYKVLSYTASIKFSNMAFDFIQFQTTIDLDSDTNNILVTKDEPWIASIYNLSYFYKKWIYSVGRRFEENEKELFKNEKFTEESKKDFGFLGAQYAADNGLIWGGFINYYLLGDLSIGLTYFF